MPVGTKTRQLRRGYPFSRKIRFSRRTKRSRRMKRRDGGESLLDFVHRRQRELETLKLNGNERMQINVDDLKIQCPKLHESPNALVIKLKKTFASMPYEVQPPSEFPEAGPQAPHITLYYLKSNPIVYDKTKVETWPWANESESIERMNEFIKNKIRDKSVFMKLAPVEKIKELTDIIGVDIFDSSHTLQKIDSHNGDDKVDLLTLLNEMHTELNSSHSLPRLPDGYDGDHVPLNNRIHIQLHYNPEHDMYYNMYLDCQRIKDNKDKKVRTKQDLITKISHERADLKMYVIVFGTLFMGKFKEVLSQNTTRILTNSKKILDHFTN